MEFLKDIFRFKDPDPKEMRDHLVNTLHPDLHDNAEEKNAIMAEVNAAYEDARSGKPKKLLSLYYKYKNLKPPERAKPSGPPHKKIDTYV